MGHEPRLIKGHLDPLVIGIVVGVKERAAPRQSRTFEGVIHGVTGTVLARCAQKRVVRVRAHVTVGRV